MTRETKALIRRLAEEHTLQEAEFEALVDGYTPEAAALLAAEARRARTAVYGDEVYLRGLIEISNICKNDCLYCGIRRSNARCVRYRLTPAEILQCADEGYRLGFRTFVLQGGEDAYYTDGVLCPLIRSVKAAHPDCAVTLSLGERSRGSYARLREAGADRYLLRHETADEAHYRLLHPPEMSFENRMACLRTLRALGYQVGCGFMVGSPGQTSRMIARDLCFIADFRPEMCGIGPFIPHHETPFRAEPAGSVALTCYLLSILRLIDPTLLLPATTALGTLHPGGRELGLLAGANVVMPNLSPVSVRARYELYDNKICTGEESAQCHACLEARIASVGLRAAVSRGDVRRSPAEGREAAP